MEDDDTMPPIAQTVQSRRPQAPPRAAFPFGPRPLGAITPGLARQVYRKQNPASAQIVMDWETIVGPKVAAMTVPRRLDRGQLTIACSGATAMNLHYVGQELIQRINTHLGSTQVRSLRFTQAGMPKRERPAAAPPPEAVREADAAVADLPEGPVRDALAALGRVVIGRAKHATKRPAKF
jgi:hypothetical protein